MILSSKDLSYDDLLQLVKVFESSTEFNEFHLKYGDVELDLRKHGAGLAPAAVSAPVRPATAVAAKPETQVVTAPVPVSATEAGIPAGSQAVKSPMVGTFYRSPEPGATPFVSIGQRVTAETTVCIIEVMKLMSSIRADHAGVVTAILVQDATPVEFGQALIVIDPNA